MRRRRAVTSLLPQLVLGALLAACSGGRATPPPADAACVPVVVRDSSGEPIDLSGQWSANDSGRYQLKQLDSCLVWVGLSDFEDQSLGDSWITTFRGQIGSDRVISGPFLDVSGNNAGSGTLTLRIDDDDGAYLGIVLNIVSHTGSPYGGTFWERVRPAEPTAEPTAGPSDERTQTPGGESPAGGPTSPVVDSPAGADPSTEPSSAAG